MASATLTAKLVGDAKGMVDAFDKGEKSAGALGGAIGKVGAIASGFVVGAALSNLPALLGSMTAAAAEDAASVARLKQAVDNTGESWAKHAASMEAVIAKGQALAFTDDQTRSGLAILTAQTGSATEAQSRYALAMDLARGANIDVVTASRLLGKVTDENVNVLNRYGISVAKGSSETELFGAIADKFGGQALAFANSEAGRMEIMTDKLGEAKEEIGKGLIPAQLALAGVMTDVALPAFAAVAHAIRFVAEHGDTLRSVLAAVATTTTIMAIPSLVKLAIATWAHVAALTAQAVAFAVANPWLVAAGLAAGVAVGAYLKMSGSSDRATDAIADLGDSAKALVPDLNNASSAAAGLSGSLAKVTFASLTAKVAQESLMFGTGEYERDLPGYMAQLKSLYEQESALADATDSITEAITGKKAAQAAETYVAKAATEAVREQEKALRDLSAATEKAAARNDSLAASFGRLGDVTRENANRDFAGRLVASGISPEVAKALATTAPKIGTPQEAFDLVNAALAKGTIDAGTGLRLLEAARTGTPDPLMLQLGLVPGLADGGIVRARSGGTLALLGEGGRDEAVVPLGSGGYGGNTYVTVNIQTLDAQTAVDATVRVLGLAEAQGRISNVTVVG